ncbi:hybrid sensor histidine kinase/response regulator transcription factor [Algoriphagus jejuensis]|uniref:histidine kinase n=1 Tax=Algoriphagus jejuensis TaxID=419934 RepID=A0ABN1MZA3_9BACT
MIIRFLILVVVLLGSMPGLYAQQIKFEHYSEDNGLVHNSIRHFAQDKQGFLWIGTFGGLSRFDGYEFEPFVSTQGQPNTIPNDDITALELDEASRHLWIGTRNGISLYHLDIHVFQTFHASPGEPDSLQDEEIRALHVDRFNQVWVGTRDQGLFIFTPKTNTFRKVPLPGFNYIREIIEDSQGNVWVGSYQSAGVAKLQLDASGEIKQTKTYTLQVPFSQNTNPYLNFIYEDHKADIFVGTRSGLFKLDSDKDQFENLYIQDRAVREKLGPYFNSIARAPGGKYWLGTLGGLLVMDRLEDVAGKNFEWYFAELSNDGSLSDDFVTSLFFDQSGALWVGTENGLDKFDPYANQFRYFRDISNFIGYQKPLIRGFAKAYDGSTVVATRHNGIFVKNNGRFVHLFDPREDIASIFSVDGVEFYCGLWDGRILQYNYRTKVSKLIDLGFSTSPITNFAAYGKDSLLIGSHGSGSRLVHRSNWGMREDFSPVLPSQVVNSLRVDSKGIIWYATTLGAVQYDPNSGISKLYTAKGQSGQGLSHTDISDIQVDYQGNVWAATRLGLDRYDRQLDDFAPVLGAAELQGRWITDIQTNASGELWLNMNNNRVANYQVQEEVLKTYYVESGNRLDMFSHRGFFLADDSSMYLGGSKGVIFFSPKQLVNNELSPKPFITSVRIQNQEVQVGEKLNGQLILDRDINESKTLELDYINRNFSLTFSSPAYINERLNKFSYMLEGFDETWNTVDVPQRSVQYTNLFFGDYVFKIKAMNSHGVWSEEVSYAIHIRPPFWLTYQAFILLAMLLVVVFILVRRLVRARRQLKQELLIEKVQRERDENLNQEKLQFFTNIAHELRTPLTLILGPIRQLLEEKGSKEEDFQLSRYQLIDQNTSRLIKLVNQFLDFRKAQSGSLSLKVSNTDILRHTRLTFSSFHDLARDKNIRFRMACESEAIHGYIDRDKYDKVLYNLLSNALKFTFDNGVVDLFLDTRQKADGLWLLVEVSDDGVGIPAESMEKIFSRFYQAPNNRIQNTGSGIGLSLVRDLVKLHKGEISVKSEEGKGSVFTLELPIQREAYLPGEIFEVEKEPTEEVKPLGMPESKVETPSKQRELILVVEDNSELRTYLKDYLSAYYRVLLAENGKEGLEICLRESPALCVADVMMPVMDGMEFCDRLKETEEISHIPIVLLTALSDNESQIRGYTSGADGYLVKPFDPVLLRSRIENILRSRRELKAKFSSDMESEPAGLAHSPFDAEFLGKITDLIETKLDDPDLNTGFLCQEVAMSSSTFYRKIKELTGLAPNEFVRTIRLKKAAQLLKTKSYTVSEVTDRVGFSDPLYFSRCFKKQFGFPPSTLTK